MIFNFFKKTKPKDQQIPLNEDYQRKIENEINFYKDCHDVHALPEIFHYWSNKYLLPKQTPFGFSNPDDFFVKQCIKHIKEKGSHKNIEIVSVGSGNGELEVLVAASIVDAGFTNFTIECLDINSHMLERTMSLAKEKGVEKHIIASVTDFNKWEPNTQYDLILANQSLHHVLDLEHLFSSIYQAMKPNGQFITSDMIGRNGHMRWPEALEALQPFWKELPDSHKYNQLLKRHEEDYINHDCSTTGFEGIRAQDILPLLVDKFNFELFIPFANLIMVFIDRPFGHNFDPKNPKDLDFIDRVHAKDEELMLNGTIKPTQMLAVMSKQEIKNPQLLNSKLTPDFCIRKVD